MSGDRNPHRGLRVGPWLPPPRTSLGRRGRHSVGSAAVPAPVPDPAAAPPSTVDDRPSTVDSGPASRPLPVDVAAAPTGRPAAGGWLGGGRRVPGGRWWVAAAIAVGLAAAVVVPLAAARHPGRPATSAPAGGTTPAALPPVPDPSGVGPEPSPSAVRSAAPSHSPGRSAVPSRGVPPVAARVPITIEAEDPRNSLGGSAWVAAYPGASGGRIVRNIGVWNGSPRHAGWLRFNAVTPPAAGTYVLAVYAVHLDDAPNRTIVVTVSGAAPVTVAVSASDTCCTTFRLRVTLHATGNTITFTNTSDHAPSIDRIVLSAA